MKNVQLLISIYLRNPENNSLWFYNFVVAAIHEIGQTASADQEFKPFKLADFLAANPDQIFPNELDSTQTEVLKCLLSALLGKMKKGLNRKIEPCHKNEQTLPFIAWLMLNPDDELAELAIAITRYAWTEWIQVYKSPLAIMFIVQAGLRRLFVGPDGKPNYQNEPRSPDLYYEFMLLTNSIAITRRMEKAMFDDNELNAAFGPIREMMKHVLPWVKTQFAAIEFERVGTGMFERDGVPTALEKQKGSNTDVHAENLITALYATLQGMLNLPPTSRFIDKEVVKKALELLNGYRTGRINTYSIDRYSLQGLLYRTPRFVPAGNRSVLRDPRELAEQLAALYDLFHIDEAFAELMQAGTAFKFGDPRHEFEWLALKWDPNDACSFILVNPDEKAHAFLQIMWNREDSKTLMFVEYEYVPKRHSAFPFETVAKPLTYWLQHRLNLSAGGTHITMNPSASAPASASASASASAPACAPASASAGASASASAGASASASARP